MYGHRVCRRHPLRARSPRARDLLRIQPRACRRLAPHVGRPRLRRRGLGGRRRGGKAASPRRGGLCGPGASLRPGRRPHPRHHDAGGQRLHARLAVRHPRERGHGHPRLPLPAAARARREPPRVARHHGRGALCARGNRQGRRLRLLPARVRAHGHHDRRGWWHAARRLPWRGAANLPEVQPLRALCALRIGGLLRRRGPLLSQQALGRGAVRGPDHRPQALVASLRRADAGGRGPHAARGGPRQARRAPRWRAGRRHSR